MAADFSHHGGTSSFALPNGVTSKPWLKDTGTVADGRLMAFLYGGILRKSFEIEDLGDSIPKSSGT